MQRSFLGESLARVRFLHDQMRELVKLSMGASIYRLIGYDDAWVLRNSCNEKLYIFLAIQAM
jgi:hypothetical protein